MDRTITPQALKTLLQADAAVQLLDIRRQADYAGSQEGIAGAAWHDPEQIGQWSAGLPKEKEIVVYCVRGGAVSNASIDQLRQQGYRARYIEGGIEGWKAAGGPVAEK